MRASKASELANFSHFHIFKTAVSFNICVGTEDVLSVAYDACLPVYVY